MIEQCKGCRYYAKDNDKMREAGTKTIIGNYCLRFKWNLDVYKTWYDKQTEVKGNNYPKMKQVPRRCFTGPPMQ